MEYVSNTFLLSHALYNTKSHRYELSIFKPIVPMKSSYTISSNYVKRNNVLNA